MKQILSIVLIAALLSSVTAGWLRCGEPDADLVQALATKKACEEVKGELIKAGAREYYYCDTTGVESMRHRFALSCDKAGFKCFNYRWPEDVGC